MTKLREVARQRFLQSGVSVADWARANGFNTNLVYQVLRGERKALRGQTHDIAVKLGLKKGVERAEGRRRLLKRDASARVGGV